MAAGQGTGKRLAVLIDAENIAPALFITISKRIETLGTPTVWMAFGDFVDKPKSGWVELGRRGDVALHQQFHNGKNAADIALTVAAMDSLHAGIAEGVCIVSSDSDFTALVRRLRAAGLVVYGLGEAKAAAAYRNACTAFFTLVEDRPPTPSPKPGVPADQGVAVRGAALRRLRDLVAEACREEGEDGKLSATELASFLNARAPDLAEQLRKGGRFLKRLQHTGLVDVHEDGTLRLVSLRAHPIVMH